MVVASCGGGEAPAAGGGADPLRIGLLISIPGEDDPSAVPNGFDGARMAIEEINAAGGVLGMPVEYTRTSYNIGDPAKSRQAFLDSLAEESDVRYGAMSGSGIDAIVAGGLLDDAAAPMIAYGAPTVDQSSEDGSEWLFQVRSHTRAQAAAITRWMLQEHGYTRVGVMYVDTQYGHFGLEGIEAALSEAGIEPVAVQGHAATATDVTSSALAMQNAGAEVVIDWTFPAPLGVQLNQFHQMGITVPTVTSASYATVVNGGLASEVALAASPDTVGVNGCLALATSTDPATAEFATRFAEKFGYPPDETATVSYDAMHLIAATATAAGSTDPAALRDALANSPLTGSGVCQAEYRADETGTLAHTAAVVGLGPDGRLVTREVIDIP